MSDPINQIAQLHEWIECVEDWNEGLRLIPLKIDKKLAEYKQITDDEQAIDAGVDLIFVRNRLEHMINTWLGEGVEDAG